MDRVIAIVHSELDEWLCDLARVLTTAAPTISFRWCLSITELPQLKSIAAIVSATPIDHPDAVVLPKIGSDTLRVVQSHIYHSIDTPSVSILSQEPSPNQSITSHSISQGQDTLTHLPAILVPVLARGGAGGSTVAMALSQALAAHTQTTLIDLKVNPELAMLHDLVGSHRHLDQLVLALSRNLPANEIDRYLNLIPNRRYRLGTAQRGIERWQAITPGLYPDFLRSFLNDGGAVVADLEPQLYCGTQVGLPDLDEFTFLPRATLQSARCAVIVSRADLKGRFSGVNLAQEVLRLSSQCELLVFVVNAVTGKPREMTRIRHETETLLGEALGSRFRHLPKVQIVAIPSTPLDDIHRRVAQLPDEVINPLDSIVTDLLLLPPPQIDLPKSIAIDDQLNLSATLALESSWSYFE
ncbi:MAG: hypothetical protein ACYDHP_04950 [Ferrimicrobium sp.]